MADINEKILTKIRNLLALAEDGKDDEESQTALLLAQKLMLKHKVSQNELTEDDQDKIITRSLSIYKRLYWYEKILVKVIADNFRVMYYVQSNKFPHQKTVQRKIVLMGYKEDVDLAYEVYHLAEDSMKYFSKLYVEETKDQTDTPQHMIRRAYCKGFIDGLEEKFKKQREALEKEDEAYALAVLVPEEVKEKYSEVVTGKMSFKEPSYSQDQHDYIAGFQKGQEVDLDTKKLE